MTYVTPPYKEYNTKIPIVGGDKLVILEIIKKEQPRKLRGCSFTYDPYGIRTRVTAVKGRCLNHLTNGPLVAAEGVEPTTFRV